MKLRFSIFIMMLCLVVAGLSARTTPVFSTEAEPVWYQVQFVTGSATLADQGSGKTLVTQTKADTDAQKWQLIGTADSFIMKSKAGNYVGMSGTYFAAVSASEAVKLYLYANDANGCYEIGRYGESTHMNQWGGTGAGKSLGEWTSGDSNNMLNFLATSSVYPVFSTDDTEEWYFIQFANSGNVVESNGTGKACTLGTAEPTNNKLWKVVGTATNFQLVNKDGNYACVTGTGNSARLYLIKNPYSAGFSMVETTNSTYAPAWEIVGNGITTTNNRLNQWGGTEQGNQIGFWSAGDVNNPLQFVNEKDMIYADYNTEGISGYTPEHDLTLWYTEPATTAQLYSGGQGYSNWMEYSLPIGDGQFGASLFGGVYKDEIQFNEKTLWTGRSTDLTSGGSGYGIYQNFGSVYAEDLSGVFGYTSDNQASDYYRQLDLTTATGKTSFKDCNGVTYTREYIASNPARVVVAHYTASASGKISLRFTMAPGSVTSTTTYANGEGTFSGSLETVSYNARFKVIPTGGTMTTTADGIEVRGADEVLVILGGGTDFDAYSSTYVSNTDGLAETIQNRVSAAAAKSWDDLYAEHLADFQSFFSRVNFQLDGTKNTVPTNTLIDNYNSGNGADALMLERLYFAYGRYLEISSSRGVDVPSNLQGIWSNMSNPAWNADIHANINVQMNYWPAEPTNLSEMHMPFLNYIWNMAMNHSEWQGYAKDIAGQSRGWTCFTENNIFGGGTKFASYYVIANAWYCTHLWQHYRYTLDKEYLQKVFPAMLSATYFWIDRLILASDGTYEAPNEWSPEQGPYENGVAHAQQLVAELFSNTIDAIAVLGQEASGISTDDYNKLLDRYAKLDKGLNTETYTGTWGNPCNGLAKGQTILREWKYSAYTVGENGHRHMSHLMCMYPFSQVTPGTDEFNAAVNSMTLRGDGATGWSMGWKINLWARAQQGDHARTILNNALSHANGGSGVFYNLFDSHAPFQIDGNFGACAGIAEMLMQSNSGEISLLPALPSAWKKGSVSGLKAVGNFTVDVAWEDNKPTVATITSNAGQPLVVNCADITKATVYVNGEKVTPASSTESSISINTAKDDVVKIAFTDSESALNEISADNAQGISVSNRTVNVAGEPAAINVYDMLGRRILSPASSTFTVPVEAGSAVIVNAVYGDGHTATAKVAL
jgi:alpha-L-fucosidase 2